MEISLESLWQTLRKYFVIILILALIVGIGTYFVSEFMITPKYVSQARINIIGDENTTTVAEQNNSYVYANRLVSTCVILLSADDFRVLVREKAGLDHTTPIQVSSTEDTTCLTLAVTDADPQVAYNAAMAAAEYANEWITEKSATRISVKVYDSARMPTQPSSPQPLRNAVIAFFAAAVVVYLIEFLRESFGVKIKNELDLEKRYNLPVIAVIPDFNDNLRHADENLYSSYADKGGKRNG